MIDILPSVPDGIDYYAFVPMLATLYGHDEEPYRFVRVVDKHVLSGRSTTHHNEGGQHFIIENVDIETYLTFMSYGFSPYVETALTGYKSGIGIEDYQQYYVSQALLRNYETRIQSLIDTAEKKRLSVLSGTTSNQSTAELCCEIEGALAMWEMLMNSGTLDPRNCIAYIRSQNKDSLFIPIARYKEKFEELDNRLLMNSFANLPFKITDDKRERFVSAFK